MTVTSGDAGMRQPRGWRIPGARPALLIEVLAIAAVMALMCHVVLNALTRLIYNQPLEGTTEYVRFWYMPLLCLVGFVMATARREHIEATLLFDRLPTRAQRDLQRLGYAVMCVLSLGIAWYSLQESLNDYRIGLTGGVSGVVIWPATFAVPLAFIAIAGVTVIQAAQMSRGVTPELKITQPVPEAGTRTVLPGAGPGGTEATTSVAGGGRQWAALLGRLAPWGLIAVCSYLMLGGVLVREGIGLTAVVMMLILMFLKVPIFAALAVPGLIGLWGVTGSRAVKAALASQPYDGVATWELSVLPMFMMMGLLLYQAGVTRQLYLVCRRWTSWLPGGLAVGTNAAGAGLAAITGSALGTVYALGRAGIPEMLRYGYHRRLALGSVLTASLPGQLIPPSVGLVIYAGIAEVPVGPQLLAGALPGVLVAALACVFIIAISTFRPHMAGRGGEVEKDKSGWMSLLAISLQAWPVPVLMIVVLGGMYSGVMTSTEAGAAGAFGALLITIGARRKDRPAGHVLTAVRTTIASAGAIFMVLLGAQMFARMLSVTGLGPGFTEWVVTNELTRVELLLIMVVAYLIMGMFMDPLSMMLLTVPLLLPTLEHLDISLLWYGVFMVFMGETAVITPPVGILSFVLYRVAREPDVNLGQDISLKDVFVSVGWFMPMVFAFLAILIAFPEIATFIPDRSGSG